MYLLLINNKRKNVYYTTTLSIQLFRLLTELCNIETLIRPLVGVA